VHCKQTTDDAKFNVAGGIGLNYSFVFSEMSANVGERRGVSPPWSLPNPGLFHGGLTPRRSPFGVTTFLFDDEGKATLPESTIRW
jgi:hypothetical protein